MFLNLSKSKQKITDLDQPHMENPSSQRFYYV